jgi:hypothetical protein
MTALRLTALNPFDFFRDRRPIRAVPIGEVAQAAPRAWFLIACLALGAIGGSSRSLTLLAQENVAAMPPEAETPVAKQEVAAAEIDLSDRRTLGTALRAIAEHHAIEFRHPLPDDTPIQPLGKPLSFWQALDHVLDEAGLDMDLYGSDANIWKLRVSQPLRPRRTTSATYAGAFRLEPTVVTSRRVLRHPALSGLSVEIELAWPPGAKPIGLTLPLDRIHAVLSDGETLAAAGGGGGVIDVATGPDIPSAVLQIPLQFSPLQATQIDALTGQLRSLLPVDPQRFELALDATAAAETRGSITLRGEGVRKNEELHEVRLGIEVDVPSEAMESHRGFLLNNEVYAVTADGTRVEHLGYQLYRQAENGIGIAYLFDVGDSVAGCKLIYESPTRIVRDQVEFVIDNIPLP